MTQDVGTTTRLVGTFLPLVENWPHLLLKALNVAWHLQSKCKTKQTNV